jgi:hypothetical protein
MKIISAREIEKLFRLRQAEETMTSTLQRPKSRSTGRTRPDGVIWTRMLPGCGSALKKPST